MLDVRRRGMVLLGQLHLDVGVGRADGRRGRVGEVQAGIRQADVIDNGDDLFGRNILADGRVDVVAEGCRLFDARAGAGADVNLELAGVNRREEVLAQKRRKSQRSDGEKHKENQKDRRVVHA